MTLMVRLVLPCLLPVPHLPVDGSCMLRPPMAGTTLPSSSCPRRQKPTCNHPTETRPSTWRPSSSTTGSLMRCHSHTCISVYMHISICILCTFPHARTRTHTHIPCPTNQRVLRPSPHTCRPASRSHFVAQNCRIAGRVGCFGGRDEPAQGDADGAVGGCYHDSPA